MLGNFLNIDLKRRLLLKTLKYCLLFKGNDKTEWQTGRDVRPTAELFGG